MEDAGSLGGGDTGYRVLLVEDDPGDALLIEEYLIDAAVDISLRWTRSMAEAEAAAAEADFDCVLLDLHLPDNGGPVSVRRAVAAFPDTAVIVLSGMAEESAGIGSLAAGAQDYLVKSRVDGDVLARAVRYATLRKSSERSNAELLQTRLQAQENIRLERGLLPVPVWRDGPAALHTRYQPGRDRTLLGGDFLDAVETEKGVVHAVIGDVSGHGPDEAALGVCLRSSWRALVMAGLRGADLLAVLEQVLLTERRRPDVFATCTTLTLDLTTAPGQATICLAGHHEPLLLTNKGATVVGCDLGIALGILPGIRTWYPTRLAVPAGGTLLLFTDGLIEGYTGAGHDRLGVGGLIGLIDAAGLPPGPQALDFVLAEAARLNAGRHVDDTAVMALTWP